ncbi:MAG: PASTA domain-containing protein, partial [Actinomycetota bacterium]
GQTAQPLGYVTVVNGASTDPVTVTASTAGGETITTAPLAYPTGAPDVEESISGIVPSGDYDLAFTGGTADAALAMTVVDGSGQTIVSGYGDIPEGGDTPATAKAYPVDMAPIDAGMAKVTVWNATLAEVVITVGASQAALAPGEGLPTQAVAADTVVSITIDDAVREITATADSYTDVFAVNDGATPSIAVATIPSMTELIASLTAPEKVTVPDVVGQTEADATAVVTDAGLVATAVEAPDDAVPAGTVISQDPAADTLVDPGAEVTITVSTGPATVPVPDVVGQTEADANAAITGAGLTVVKTEAPDDAVPAGSVAAQSPAAGTLVDPGAEVTIAVSTGPATVPVPDVVGQTEADANAAITGAGLSVAKVEAPDDTVPVGGVAAQNPAAGTLVDPGAQVTITVSTGPDVPSTVPVPDVTGKTANEALSELEAAGFTVQLEEEDSADVEEGLVIGTNPSAGTEVAPGTTVVVTVSSGPPPVVVPDLIGMTADEAEAAAADAGLTITFEEDPEEPDPDGFVVGQDPSAGSPAEPGSEVVAQLSPKTGEPWATLTLDDRQILTVAGINFLPGSTVELRVIDTEHSAEVDVDDNGTWGAQFVLSNFETEEALLLVTGTATNTSEYVATFKIPATGEITHEPEEEIETDEDASGRFWLWFLFLALVVAAAALIFIYFGDGWPGGDGGAAAEAAGAEAAAEGAEGAEAVEGAEGAAETAEFEAAEGEAPEAEAPGDEMT